MSFLWGMQQAIIARLPTRLPFRGVASRTLALPALDSRPGPRFKTFILSRIRSDLARRTELDLYQGMVDPPGEGALCLSSGLPRREEPGSPLSKGDGESCQIPLRNGCGMSHRIISGTCMV